MSSQALTFVLNNGARIPAIGFGCFMGFYGGGQRVYDMCTKALKHGYRHFDTATAYGNEKQVGQAIRNSGISRDELFITTKLPIDWKDVGQSFEQSLQELDCAYIDLYLMHWPQHAVSGNVLGPGEQPDFIYAWKEMEKLLNTGKVKSIGVSNFSIRTLAELLPHCTVIPATNQVELHPCLPQNDLKEFCESKGVLLTAYSPLGRSTAFFTEPTIKAVAEKNGLTPAQVVLSWGIQRGTPVIPKSENEERILENSKLLKLPDEDVKAINAIHAQPGMHRSLLKYHEPNGTVFGWTYQWLGWNMKTGGIIA